MALVAVYTSAYSVYGLFRHWRFDSGAYDLGIFDQVIWHLSRFEAPASSIRGDASILGDHFSPVLILLVPAYWVAPRPEALIVAQAALLTASIVPVFLYARQRLPTDTAYLFAAAYGLFWGIQRTAAFDFHEMAFAPLAVAVAILAVDASRWPLFWTMMVALIGIKEDMIPLVGGFGLLLMLRGSVRHGIAAIILSCVAFWLVVGVIVPAMNTNGQFGYTEAYASVIHNPWRIPLEFVSPPTKLRTLAALLGSWLFLPLLSPLTLLAAPAVATRFLSSSPNHWGVAFHYWAPVSPILAMAAADGLARLTEWLRTRAADAPTVAVGRACAIVCLVACTIIPGHQPLLRLFRPSTYEITATHQTGHRAIRLIPRDASVVAQNAILPHVSDRDQVFLLRSGAIDAEFVVASAQLDPWPLASVAELRVLIDRYRMQSYEPVFDEDGWIVLRRPRGRGPAMPR